MTFEEAIPIFSKLRGAYRGYYRGMTRKDAVDLVNLWVSVFRDIPANDVMKAVTVFITEDVKGFHPSVGQIKERVVVSRTSPDWVEPYVEDLMLSPVGVSHYARAHGISWKEAEKIVRERES